MTEALDIATGKTIIEGLATMLATHGVDSAKMMENVQMLMHRAALVQLATGNTAPITFTPVVEDGVFIGFTVTDPCKGAAITIGQAWESVRETVMNRMARRVHGCNCPRCVAVKASGLSAAQTQH